MHIQNLLNQNINTQLEQACKWGWRLHFLASDLRTFASAIGSNNLSVLDNYAWYKHHFNGGFAASSNHKVATNSGNYNYFGFCVRESQSNVLNTTEKKGNLGADLITGRAMQQMMIQGLSGLTTNNFGKDNNKFHCEHAFQVNHIDTLLRDRILKNNKIDPKSLIRFVIDHSLVVTVFNDERKDGGNNLNNNISPFWRYSAIGANVLQYTDNGFEDVTNSTIQEINSNRWNRNKYFKAFREAFENLDPKVFDNYKDEVYTSFYMKERHSNCCPILNEENLKILTRNNYTEIATTFYPDKFKDRWVKNNEELPMA